MKVCSKCREEKPLEDFHKSSRNGFQSQCKECKKRDQQNRKFLDKKETEKKACTTCGETKPSSMFSKDNARLDGLVSSCKTCVKLYLAERKRGSKERIASKECSTCKQILPRDSFSRHLHTSTGLTSQCKICSQKYAKDNKEKGNAKTAKYKASKLRRTPGWLADSDFEEIRKIYLLCQCINKVSEEPYEVDHIIPLQGETVCGLHVPDNLQIISRFENRSKSNKFGEYGE